MLCDNKSDHAGMKKVGLFHHVHISRAGAEFYIKMDNFITLVILKLAMVCNRADPFFKTFDNAF